MDTFEEFIKKCADAEHISLDDMMNAYVNCIGSFTDNITNPEHDVSKFTIFRCKKCECISNGDFEIKTDKNKEEKWNEEHAKRLELQAKQKIIIDEFEEECRVHNAKKFNFKKWYVYKGSGITTNEYDELNILYIVSPFNKKPINQTPFDGSVMDIWLQVFHRKPEFTYICCPVCHCKHYIKHC